MESYESLVASGLTPIKPTPIVNGRVPPPSAPSMGRALVGTIPPEMQLDADFAENQYGGQVPSYRLMPPASSGKAAVNAAAQSTQIVVQQSSVGSGLLLETLGAKNPNQSVLNLQGTAVVGVDAAGNVTIDGGGDGLIHGDSIQEIDPAYVLLRDDFVMGGTGAGSIGQLSWNTLGTLGSTPFYAAGLGFPAFGEFTFPNNTTANVLSGIYLLQSGAATSNQQWPLFDYPGWKLIYNFRFHRINDNINDTAPNFTKKALYVGLGWLGGTPAPASRPSVFMGVRFDTNSGIADTTMKLEVVQNTLSTSRNNTLGTVIDTGIIPSEDVYYRLEIVCIASGIITMSLNGSTPQTFSVATMATVAGTSSEIQGANGQAIFSVATTFFGGGAGGKFVVSGLTGGNSVLNGNYLCTDTNAPGQLFVAPSSATLTAVVVTGWTITGFPCVTPFFSCGNDSTASPTTNLRMCADFFSFVWNPGVGGGTGTPNPTKARYF